MAPQPMTHMHCESQHRLTRTHRSSKHEKQPHITRMHGLCCRAIVPAFMGIGIIVIERRLPPPAEFATLALLGLGVGMAMWEGTAVGSPFASMCCMTSAACHTAVIYFSGKVQPIAPG